MQSYEVQLRGNSAIENREEMALWQEIEPLPRLFDYACSREQGGEFFVDDFFQSGKEVVYLTERASIDSRAPTELTVRQVISTAVIYPALNSSHFSLMENCDYPKMPGAANAVQVRIAHAGEGSVNFLFGLPKYRNEDGNTLKLLSRLHKEIGQGVEQDISIKELIKKAEELDFVLLEFR